MVARPKTTRSTRIKSPSCCAVVCSRRPLSPPLQCAPPVTCSAAALLRDVELTIVKTAKHHDAHTLSLLQTVPGIGKILSLVRLYDIHDIARFPRVQDVASSCRLVTCARASAGKRSGTSGATIGNAHLTW